MNSIGKMTVKARDSGLLTARRTSRQAIAKVAFASRPMVARRLAGTGPTRGRAVVADAVPVVSSPLMPRPPRAAAAAPHTLPRGWARARAARTAASGARR